MTRSNRDDVGLEEFPKQGEVPNDIEDLLADEFILEAKEFLQRIYSLDNDYAIQASSLIFPILSSSSMSS